jgi:glycerol-3-phosphate acyltransferase PlsX
MNHTNQIIIALDAMGGDNAPFVVIAGASLAVKKNKNLYFNIYGNENIINSILKKYSNLKNKYTLFHTESVISNDDKPSDALRKGRDSSMRLAINYVKNHPNSAVVSAGNTGALMATSKFVLQMIESIDRPAIVTYIPTRKKPCVLLDLGANASCSPQQLLQFAIMGSVFSSVILGIQNPRIGLLNIGSESLKGNDLVKEAAELISQNKKLNYIGFAEGDDLFSGDFDVIVSDGFTGNIALKVLEGTVKFFGSLLKKVFVKSIVGYFTLSLVLILRAFKLKQLSNIIDPRNYNGAMLIGLNGVSVKSHGSADAKSYANAIKVAYMLCEGNVNEKIKEKLKDI